ncbi:hypothetical protein [Clostridium tertium]|uniref:hypothetical protein n=1 Tax=Clostridium tertium TaxID=1559 RepID=UPI0023B2C8B3|nr:hypothetical protein [Clostridium tertium]
MSHNINNFEIKTVEVSLPDSYGLSNESDWTSSYDLIVSAIKYGLINGIAYVNVTAEPIYFRNDELDKILQLPPSGVVIKTVPKINIVETDRFIEFASLNPTRTIIGIAQVSKITYKLMSTRDIRQVLIIGSSDAARAYSREIVSAVPYNLNIDEKIMSMYMFSKY